MSNDSNKTPAAPMLSWNGHQFDLIQDLTILSVSSGLEHPNLVPGENGMQGNGMEHTVVGSEQDGCGKTPAPLARFVPQPVCSEDRRVWNELVFNLLAF